MSHPTEFCTEKTSSPDGSESQINATKFQIKTKLKEEIKAGLKQRGCHWNDYEGAYTCEDKHREFVVAYLETHGIKFNLENIRDGYFLLSKGEQKAARLNQAQMKTFNEGYNQLMHVQSLLKDYNAKWGANLKPGDFENLTEESASSLLTTEDARQLEHLRLITGEFVKFNEMRALVAELRDKEELARLGEAAASDALILSAKSPLVSAEELLGKNFKQGDLNTIHFCGDAFWQWNGMCYEELRPNRVRQHAYNFLKNAKVKTLKDGKTVLVDFDPNQAKVNNVLDAFKAICECNLIPESGSAWIENNGLPSVDSLIVFKNGILDVAAWLKDKATALIPHTPLLMNPGFLPFDFEPSCQEPAEWLSFLRSIWADDQQSIDTLQEWFGYCLVQDTSHHKILLIVGPPRSGKGTIGRILRLLLGSRNVVGPTLSSLAGQFGLQPWLNKGLAIISDARLSGKSDQGVITERLLSISGEDPLTIDRKHREPITTTLPTRITIMTNELPHLGDSSGAIVNRYIILPMTKSWLGEEDMELENRIRKELPQILAWALEGLKRLKGRGRLVQPESAKQHFEEIMAMSSPIKAFIADRCEVGPQKYIETKALFQAWVKWCEDTGHDRPGNLQVFGRNLRAALPGILPKQRRVGAAGASRDGAGESRDKDDRMRVYEGIGLSILPN